MSDRESLLSAPTLALDPDLIRAIAWAEADWREWPGEGSQWLFWTTHEEMGRP